LNAEEAARVAIEEAKRGDADAQVVVGMMYLTGRGVEQDAELAVSWLRQAADQNDANAQYNLGIVYDTGFYGMLSPDPVEALTWFRQAANQGHNGAEYNLGVAYAEGKGVPQSHVRAIEWWRKAAETGNARAQFNLGVSYSNGEGVAQDDTEAMAWWHKAALPMDPAIDPQHLFHLLEGGVSTLYQGDSGRGELGNADAQYNLGCMYALGRGVAADNALALKCFRRAAQQGHSDARAILFQRLWKRTLSLGGVALVALAIVTALVLAN